ARRHGLFPRPCLSGCLRTCLPRGTHLRTAGFELPPRNPRRAWTLVLSAPMADARFLALPYSFDGYRPDQCDLSGAVHALSRTSKPDREDAAQNLGIRR